MKTILFIILPLLGFTQVEIPLSVQVSSGGNYSSELITLHYTIGEPVADLIISD